MKANQSPEWFNIRDIPQDEQGAACLWEYARQSPMLCKLAKNYHKAIVTRDPQEIEEATRDIDALEGGCKPYLFLLIRDSATSLDPKLSLKGTPWLSLPGPLRKKLKHLANSIDSVWSIGKPETYDRELNTPGMTLLHFIVIDWGKPLPEIVNDFQKWASEKKPKQTPRSRRKGKLATAKEYRSASIRALILHCYKKRLRIRSADAMIFPANRN